VKDLKEMCKERKIKGYSSMRKSQLVRTLKPILAEEMWLAKGVYTRTTKPAISEIACVDLTHIMTFKVALTHTAWEYLWSPLMGESWLDKADRLGVTTRTFL